MSGPQPEQQQRTPLGAEEQRLDELLDQILGGELPGQGYLFADAPEQRSAAEITTTPEVVRMKILRAVESCAKNVAGPYSSVPKDVLAKAALALSQAYLLLDPTLDENGVPVGAQAEATGEAQEGAAHAQTEGELATNEQEHQHSLVQAEHDARVAHQFPPRVQPNPAEKKLETREKPKTEALKGARADRPLPRPRVGQ